MVIDRILQTKTKDNQSQETGQGSGDSASGTPAIQDASKWTKEERKEFIQFRQDKAQFQADRIRRINFQTGAASNQPDTFRITGTSKATFYGEKEYKDETEVALSQPMHEAMEVEPSEEEIMNGIMEAARRQ